MSTCYRVILETVGQGLGFLVSVKVIEKITILGERLLAHPIETKWCHVYPWTQGIHFGNSCGRWCRAKWTFYL